MEKLLDKIDKYYSFVILFFFIAISLGFILQNYTIIDISGLLLSVVAIFYGLINCFLRRKTFSLIDWIAYSGGILVFFFSFFFFLNKLNIL